MATKSAKVPARAIEPGRFSWNPNIYPPSGWQFTDSVGILHKAPTLEKLVEVVSRYRASRGEAPGNPLRDIQDQLCAAYPRSCRESGSKKPRKPAKKLALAARVSKWLWMRWFDASQGRLKYVSDRESTRRAEICAKCPKNVALPKPCKSCGGSANPHREILLAGKWPSKLSKLMTCSVFGTDVAVDVILDLPLDAGRGEPGNCWKRVPK